MPTTTYLWNDITDTVAMEKDGAGNTTAVYQSAPVPFGRLRSMRRGGTTYNYHFDGRGNTTYLTDQTGKKTDAYTYDAFGTQRTATGSTQNPYRYGGQHGYQYNPATNDYYVRARVYQPKRGRWRSKDPLRFVDGLNPYLYTGNEPTNAVDPAGLVKYAVCCSFTRCCWAFGYYRENIKRSVACDTKETGGKVNVGKCCDLRVPTSWNPSCSAYEATFPMGKGWCASKATRKRCKAEILAYLKSLLTKDRDKILLKCIDLCSCTFKGDAAGQAVCIKEFCPAATP